MNIDATYIHYDPDLHKDPLQFNPLRFDVNNLLRFYQTPEVSQTTNVFMFVVSRKYRSLIVSYLLDLDQGLALESTWPK